MKICFFSSKKYDQETFDFCNQVYGFRLEYFDVGLNIQTVKLAENANAVCAFVHDDLSRPVLKALAEYGVGLLLMRCSGLDNVDTEAAKTLGIRVSFVPVYSPESVAEYTIALLLTLNRHLHKAIQRVRSANFSLEGLIGSNINGKTVGIIGVGKIGLATARILKGFGCVLQAYDPHRNKEFEALGGQYISFDEVLRGSHIITLHCPLKPENEHLIDTDALSKIKRGLVLINTSRGRLVDSNAAINALKKGDLGGLALDVYENEKYLFFEDRSDQVIKDDNFLCLSSMHNVILTGHQAYLTNEALNAIANTSLSSAKAFVEGDRGGGTEE